MNFLASSSVKWYGGKWIKAVDAGTKKAIEAICKKIVSKAKSNLDSRVADNPIKLKNTVGYEIHKQRMYKAFIGFNSTGPAAAYAIYAEKGRGPGKAPPVGSLDGWIQRVLRPGKNLKGIAYVIGQKIAKYGIKPKWFLRDAFRDHKDEFVRLHRKGIVEEISKI